ncbi:SGNH/GDSL hydrolase family protein [Rhodococcus sp. 06-235-1A]|uniref:SGNH/GDSL hydrolase family protein n=1 Tax=Rhodococcus sp. 06-235-1A TaxID=2022508 RepID=UPI00117B013E|nr:SGNH/GDSL hydrolase family protein [Rhodococcus sp. 06-235-1A]
MAKSSKRGRAFPSAPSDPHKRNLIIAGVLGLVMVVAVGVGLAYDQNRLAGAEATESVGYEVPDDVTPVSGKTDLAAVGQALLAPEPYVMTVVGDSTGNGEAEWVYILAQHLSRLGRSVLIHDWDPDLNQYTTESKFGPGGVPTLTIWNGSAAGKNTVYSQANWDALVPETPNFVVFSHAHNQTDVSQGVSGVTQMVRRTLPDTAVAVILQNPRLDDAADRQAATVAALRKQFESEAARPALIDVWTAFQQAPDLAPLLEPDRFHPSRAGEELWEQVVSTALALPQ